MAWSKERKAQHFRASAIFLQVMEYVAQYSWAHEHDVVLSYAGSLPAVDDDDKLARIEYFILHYPELTDELTALL